MERKLILYEEDNNSASLLFVAPRYRQEKCIGGRAWPGQGRGETGLVLWFCQGQS